MRRSLSSVEAASIVAAATWLGVLMIGSASAHEGHSPHGNFTHYALIDDFHSEPSTTEATGEIFLRLNQARTKLHYEIVLDGTLGLKPNPADRTEPDDIIGIHIHEHVPGAPGGVGMHVLNIFGLAAYGIPGEEDADLVVNYANHTLTGIFDISDATLDPATGQPHLQFFPLTTKIIYDWLDDLDEGRLMVGVHTNETGFPTMAIHGHISRVVPEPAAGMLFAMGAVVVGALRRRSRGWPGHGCCLGM